ncbi:protein phosphatase regulatory subunit [Pseudozyma hubeiensis SY62]|uniref:Protein phosphatase regulatory subunit n=1 Tax=Pseudozyma hubeiensis (strain SY62) TaxID=1305764 RepID=R9P4U5_PSEHS|nr:protein phosphatase regulatory subunit [Pseudozyma hubeiensis SY62]GAC96262.1 protein phosphatase regulatory subunit [Pseudozyma hubeiensis SY62]
MDTEQLTSFVSASVGVEDFTAPVYADLPTAFINSHSESRSPSATSTATERPADQNHDEPSSSPTKPPSVDSNFSSVQGKTAGTPPGRDDGADVDETVSSIWDESIQNKTPTAHAPAAPASPAAPAAIHPSSSTDPQQRPDWMTDDLDESWPEEQALPQSAPAPPDTGATSSNLDTSSVTQAQAAAGHPPRPRSPIRSAAPHDSVATPSMASRPSGSSAIFSALPNPAFSAARHQARRALLKGRSSAAAAPTPRAQLASSALQAGPSTPSHRLRSHQNRRHRLRGFNAENEEGDSTIWSESESDSDSASNDSAPDDFASARGSLAENSRVTNVQTAAQHSTVWLQQKQTQSPTAGSNASSAKGTFIHKADASSLPPILRPVWQSPAKGQGGPNRKGISALGGDMFTPMKLQSMFKTPTPPDKPVHNIMSALNPFTIPDQPSDGTPQVSSNSPQDIASLGQASEQPLSSESVVASNHTTPAATTEDPAPSDKGINAGVPSTPFTFQTPHALAQDRLQVSRGMVPSQSLHNMQTLHPNGLQATALARPASAAADLGLLSGPPTPHTPMRLFKFNYDDAVTRAKLEDMVNDRTPAASQHPAKAAEVERERKRLRLDVKPRKVLTGDLMSMPMLGHSGQPQPSDDLVSSQTSTSTRQPLVDYVKESTDFMSALQDAVRVPSTGADSSPEWATEEEASSGNTQSASPFHQGQSVHSPVSSVTSPARRRRSIGAGYRNRLSQQKSPAREDVAPSAIEHESPQRVSSRRLPPDSSFITESSSNDIPMSSTLKSRASLSRRIAALAKEAESPRKLLRRISATAIAEDEVQEEFDGQDAASGKTWEPFKLAEEANAYRDEQIRQLEERIARRRQLYTPAKPMAVEQNSEQDEPATVQRPQLITLHEPTLDAIAAQRRSHGNVRHADETDLDDSGITDDFGAQDQQDGNTRRFQDGIVLYDSERIPNPPLPDPSRVLRNIASAAELRNKVPDRASMARASSLLALPTQPTVATMDVNDMEHPAKRGDRTASSNTLVDPSNARTVSGDVGSQLTITDLGGKGATITRTGSLFNISQIPEQEIENLGRGKLTFNKGLHRWEKVPQSRSSQEDLRSAAGSRNEAIEARPLSRTPIPAIPEASAELSRSLDVFSESAEEQQARAQLGARTNSFQQRLSSNNVSAADARQSDSSDPFRDFESFGQSSHAPASVTDDVGEEDESTPRPVKSQMFVSKRDSRQLYGATQSATTAPQAVTDLLPSANANSPEQSAVPVSSTPVPGPNTPPSQRATPKGLAPRTLPISTVPRSGSSLRNVVTYSPDSTVSSRHSSLDPAATEGRDERAMYRSESPTYLQRKNQAQPAGSKRPRENANINVHATPDRRAAHQHQLGTTTPRASISSISTPKSILKQPAAYRNEGAGRLNGGSHNTSSNSGAGAATPNRTISFADPPYATRARDLGLALSSRSRAIAGHRARTALETGEDEDVGAEDGRTQAISSALKMLADLTLGDEPGVLPPSALTPSKMRDLNANRSHWSYRTLQRPRKTRHSAGDDDEDVSWQQDEETYDELHGYPDMTLLTDASFNFAHDKVLEAITDVEPWEPGWDELQTIDLSCRRLESCVRLKEFLPLLEEVDLQTNELSYLTGIPASVRVLNVAHNRLTSMASFGHLLHLEELDISGNQIDSLTHLSCLKHLHTLKADGNAISSLDGIDKIRSLAHVSLSGNRLKGINLASTQWSGLETLDASHNQLISIRGLSLMRRLKSLNLDHNDLTMVDLMPTMPKLRVLRVSGNVHLQTLDVAPARRLRTLYADYCDLDRIDNLGQLEHLDNLSMRQQAEAAITWPADQLRDIRRLFLSGNAFPQGISTTSEARKPIASSLTAQPPLVQPLRFLNLVYLELSACQLMQLPADLAQVAPNLRSLNLDHNLISTLPSLEGMQRLKRLSLVGCRVKKSKSIITAVRGLSELQVLDCRTNPCTLGLYAPLIAPSASPTHRGEDGALDTDALAASWLPPVPNAQIVQPDLAASERRREAAAQRAQIEQLEKSHFHKRRAPLADYAIDPNATLARDALDRETAKRAAKDGASYSSVFQAADTSPGAALRAQSTMEDFRHQLDFWWESSVDDGPAGLGYHQLMQTHPYIVLAELELSRRRAFEKTHRRRIDWAHHGSDWRYGNMARHGGTV